MKALTRVVFVVSSVFVLITVLCIGASATPPFREPRYEAQLTMSSKPVGQTYEVQLNVKGLMDSPQTQVTLSIPKGVELVGGQKSQFAPMGRMATMQKTWSIRIKEPGHYKVFAVIQSPEEPGVRSSQRANLYITATEDEIQVDQYLRRNSIRRSIGIYS